MNNSLVSEVTDITETTEVFIDGPKKRNKGKDYKFHSEYPDKKLLAVSIHMKMVYKDTFGGTTE